MMNQETKKEIRDLTKILIKMDNTGRAIMLSNASVLLTRQEYKENEKNTERKGVHKRNKRKIKKILIGSKKSKKEHIAYYNI